MIAYTKVHTFLSNPIQEYRYNTAKVFIQYGRSEINSYLLKYGNFLNQYNTKYSKSNLNHLLEPYSSLSTLHLQKDGILYGTTTASRGYFRCSVFSTLRISCSLPYIDQYLCIGFNVATMYFHISGRQPGNQ